MCQARRNLTLLGRSLKSQPKDQIDSGALSNQEYFENSSWTTYPSNCCFCQWSPFEKKRVTTTTKLT